MTEMMSVISFRQKRDKSWTTDNLGFATPNKKGEGWDVTLFTIPAPNDGKYRICLRPPRQQQASHEPKNTQGGGGETKPSREEQLDDEIPFISPW